MGGRRWLGVVSRRSWRSQQRAHSGADIGKVFNKVGMSPETAGDRSRNAMACIALEIGATTAVMAIATGIAMRSAAALLRLSRGGYYNVRGSGGYQRDDRIHQGRGEGIYGPAGPGRTRGYQDSGLHRGGYSEGWQQGGDDGRDRDRYDPVRHGDYKDADNGYERSYGSKDAYKNNYRSGYRQGYEAATRDTLRHDAFVGLTGPTNALRSLARPSQSAAFAGADSNVLQGTGLPCTGASVSIASFIRFT